MAVHYGSCAMHRSCLYVEQCTCSCFRRLVFSTLWSTVPRVYHFNRYLPEKASDGRQYPRSSDPRRGIHRNAPYGYHRDRSCCAKIRWALRRLLVFWIPSHTRDNCRSNIRLCAFSAHRHDKPEVPSHLRLLLHRQLPGVIYDRDDARIQPIYIFIVLKKVANAAFFYMNLLFL